MLNCLSVCDLTMCSNNFSRVSTKKSTGPGYKIEYFMLQIQRLEGKHCRFR